MTSIKDRPFFCSWSGGKDSSLALYRAIQNGGIPKVLLTMLTEDGERSRSHGLPVGLVQRQAQALGIPLVVCESSWNNYEDKFLSVIRKFKEDGIADGVFGDIDLEPHLQWVERVCSSVAIRPYEPLWKGVRRDILNEFLHLGFKATIIAVKQGILSNDFLGRILDQQVLADLEKAGIDASGEEGEYHTVVTNGPIFSSAIHLEIKDRIVQDGYCFLDVSLK
jgi:diphthine-ammonia ligase